MPDLTAVRRRAAFLRHGTPDPSAVAASLDLATQVTACAADMPAVLDALAAAEQDAARCSRDAADLRQRVTVALGMLDLADPANPGRVGVLLQHLRLVLESGRDRQQVPS